MPSLWNALMKKTRDTGFIALPTKENITWIKWKRIITTNFYHYFKRTRDWSFKEREDFTLKIFRGFIVFCLLLAIIPHIFWNKDVVIYPGSNKYHEIRVNCTSHNIHEYDGKIMTEFDAFFHLHFQKCKECDF